MLQTNGYKLWPGGSQVSGNIADDGGGSAGSNATGVTTSWTPDVPTALSARDAYWIDTAGLDAIRVGAIITYTGTPSYDNIYMNFAVALYDRMAGESGYTMPRVMRFDSTSNTAAVKALGSGSALPSGILVHTIGRIDTIDEPLVFPSPIVGRVTNLAVVGGFRDSLAEYASDNKFVGYFTLPLTGAIGASYRVSACNIDGSSAAITSVGVRPFYMPLTVAYRSRGQVAQHN